MSRVKNDLGVRWKGRPELDVLIITEESPTQADAKAPARRLFQGSYVSVESTRQTFESEGIKIGVLIITEKGAVWDWEELEPYQLERAVYRDSTSRHRVGEQLRRGIEDTNPRSLALLLSIRYLKAFSPNIEDAVRSLPTPPDLFAVAALGSESLLRDFASAAGDIQVHRRRGVARITRDARAALLGLVLEAQSARTSGHGTE